MKGNRKLSPHVRVENLPYMSLLEEEVKLPTGEVIIERYNDISLLLQQNKLINNLSAEDIRYMVEQIGGNQPLESSKYSDDDLISVCKNRHIQSLSTLRTWMEHEFELCKTEKKSWTDKVKEFFSKSPKDDSSTTTTT